MTDTQAERPAGEACTSWDIPFAHSSVARDVQRRVRALRITVALTVWLIARPRKRRARSWRRGFLSINITTPVQAARVLRPLRRRLPQQKLRPGRERAG